MRQHVVLKHPVLELKSGIGFGRTLQESKTSLLEVFDHKILKSLSRQIQEGVKGVF